jgi:ribosomal protein S3AE
MAKIIKKKFFEVDIPMINEKFELIGGSLEDLNNRVIKVDVTRKLKGKGVDLIFKIVLEDGKPVALPKKITLLPFFVGHMMHKGASYVEDSITSETKDNRVVIKPFLITRKKVSNAVRRTLRNSARNWIVDYLKTKTSAEVFEEILSNQMQRPLSLKLKKIYPLAICEIRIFEIKNPIELDKPVPL